MTLNCDLKNHRFLFCNYLIIESETSENAEQKSRRYATKVNSCVLDNVPRRASLCIILHSYVAGGVRFLVYHSTDDAT